MHGLRVNSPFGLEEYLLISLGPGSAVAKEGKKRGETAKNIGERSKPRGGLVRRKARRSLEKWLWCSRPIIPDSGIILRGVLPAFDISCSFKLGKHFSFLKHEFRASNTKFWARLIAYQSLAKNMPVICCKMKKSIQNIDLFILSVINYGYIYKAIDGVIIRHSKGTVLSPISPDYRFARRFFFFFFLQFGAWFQAESWQFAAFVVHFRQGCSCFASAIKHRTWKSNNYPVSYAMHDSVE